MSQGRPVRFRHCVFATALAAALAAPSAQAAEEWQWTVAPYLWAVSFDTDLQRTVPPEGGLSTDTGFDDVLDKFDGAFLLHVEGGNGEFGVFSDFIYLGLADDHDYARFHTESDLDARMFELAGVWSPGGDPRQGIDVFAGLRYIDVDFDVQFDPEDPAFANSAVEAGDSFNDFMIGARYRWPLSDRWGLTLRGDSSFGGTEGTWNVSAVAEYRMDNGAWLLGYRHLAVEFDTGPSNVDLTVSGPLIGYGFIF
jgi:hypothetical protein